MSLQHEDETQVETNPSLRRVWHRRGHQPTVPAVGTNRRVPVFGSVEAFGRGRVEGLQATQDSAAVARYLQALEGRHGATGREIFLVLDKGPCHTSRASQAALDGRADWLHVSWLSRYSPQLNLKERAGRYLKRDARGQLAPTLRAFVDGSRDGLDPSAANAATSSTSSRPGSSPAIVAHPPVDLQVEAVRKMTSYPA